MNELKGKRIMVTGASGFIGSHLLERLDKEGAIAAGVARTERNLNRIPPRDRRVFHRADLCDPAAAFQTVMEFAPEILYHFVAHPDGPESFSQFQKTITSNLVSTVNVLEAFRLAGGRIFIFGDSTKVYGDAPSPYRSDTPSAPTSSYAICKAGGWHFCKLYRRLYGLAVVSVRPTMIYGPRQSYNLISFVIESIQQNSREIRLNGGSQTRDPLFIDDAVDALIFAGRRGTELSGKVINIGGGNELSVTELARAVAMRMDSQIPVVPVETNLRPTEITRMSCDNTEALALLGWCPMTPLDRGLDQTIEFMVAAHQESAVHEIQAFDLPAPMGRAAN
jgi:nucleoside-diphosphate-sugar epimerase